jgi:hypothetical protein
LRRLKLVVVLLGGLVSKESSTAACATVKRAAKSALWARWCNSTPGGKCRL